MIRDVKLNPIAKHCDDRGFFAEISRSEERGLAGFAQASITMTYPGVIKAFHYHKRQDDVWYVPFGNIQAVLHDLRPDSPTYGETNVFYLGEDRPASLFIPRLVAHGYRVLGNRSAYVFYLTNCAYNRENPDEFRLPWNDPSIGFDWETRFR